MFDQIPVTADKGESRKFRDWLARVQSGKETHYDIRFLQDMAQLETLEQSIRSSVMHINGKFIFIGELLSEISDKNLYKHIYSGHSDNYCADIYQYAYVRFGIRRTTTHNLISVANTFAHLGELDKRWKDFSYSQLVEMLPMSEEERKQVSPKMTIKQIREIKSVPKIQTSEFIAVEADNDVDFDTWLESKPEGTFVQGGGIDSALPVVVEEEPQIQTSEFVPVLEKSEPQSISSSNSLDIDILAHIIKQHFHDVVLEDYVLKEKAKKCAETLYYSYAIRLPK